MVWSRQTRSDHAPMPWPGNRAERFIKAAAVGAALLAVPLAVSIGEMTYESQTRASEERAASLYETTAVLQEDAPVVPRSIAFADPLVPALATWRAADGTMHEGDVFVESELAAGAETTVWLDANGEPTAAPATHDDVVSTSVGMGLQSLLLIELAVVAGYWLLMRLVGLIRSASLGAEWSRIEPKWSHRDH